MEKLESLEWSDEYVVGNKQIDTDHQELLEIYNHLVDAYNNDAPKRVYIEYLTQMTNYSLRHFRDEEAFMQRVNYDNYNNHQYEHKSFIYEVAMFNLNFDIMENKDVVRVIEFLRNWWINHVNKFDIELKNYT
jgi:hemerythrin-like metal-binding protein